MSGPFPPDLLLGVTTAAFPVEGSLREDRGPSIWDRFGPSATQTPGGGAEAACDHVRRWPDDVDLIAGLGLDAYRFSIAWPRVQPDGRGAASRTGLDLYRRLVDRLLERGVAPIAALYHWDLPQQLEFAGGWRARDTAKRFADYADVVVRALGDRVGRWLTHVDPWSAGFLGHLRGVHAPGGRDLGAALAATHHLLLSHGLAVAAARAASREARLGIALSLGELVPRDEVDGDAARLADGLHHRWLRGPLEEAAYPTDVTEHLAARGQRLGVVVDGDLAVVATPLDFLGVEWSGRRAVRALGARDPLGWQIEGGEEVLDTDAAGLGALLRGLPARPLWVSIPGRDRPDEIAPDGAVRDGARIEHLRRHLGEVVAARTAGASVEGVLAGELFDDFAWTAGFTRRRGVVHVDRADQRRTPKTSARWLTAVRRGGIDDADEDAARWLRP